MYIFKHPKWLDKFLYPYKKQVEIPASLFEAINKRLAQVTSPNPEVTVVIPAYNEEVNVIACIDSLSHMKTKVAFDIVVVDNNSKDFTWDSIRKLDVHSYMEKRQGAGPARQHGQEKAKGKYILTADADCLYPPTWMTIMHKNLSNSGVSCIYGRYSFIENENAPRYKLFIYETLRNVIAEVRHLKRPYLNSYMINMGYVKEYGLKIGFDLRGVRGEDGRMCFDLMKYGRVVQVRSVGARPWTGQRTLSQDGSLNQSLWKRVTKELGKIMEYFHPHPPHDTKSSQN